MSHGMVEKGDESIWRLQTAWVLRPAKGAGLRMTGL
jgi:hypothetical protein